MQDYSAVFFNDYQKKSNNGLSGTIVKLVLWPLFMISFMKKKVSFGDPILCDIVFRKTLCIKYYHSTKGILFRTKIIFKKSQKKVLLKVLNKVINKFIKESYSCHCFYHL